jgi:hypothetical protein
LMNLVMRLPLRKFISETRNAFRCAHIERLT